MIEILPLGKSKNAIVTLAIGDGYLSGWTNKVSQNWISYCQRFDIGLYVGDKNMDEKPTHKKLQWQKLLLVQELQDKHPDLQMFCYLDSDIAVNPLGRNIFETLNPQALNLVSQYRNLPFPLLVAQKMVSFNRHTYYSSGYPLDSSIFMSPQEIFSYHGLKAFQDYSCTGFFAGSAEQFGQVFKEIYYSYDSTVQTLTNGGDEPILNYEFMSRFKIEWQPYEFQALWIFEMAYHFPFLYNPDFYTESIARECINTVLSRNTFLHFAGSWDESKMFNLGPFSDFSGLALDFFDYLKVNPTGAPKGIIRPS